MQNSTFSTIVYQVTQVFRVYPASQCHPYAFSVDAIKWFIKVNKYEMKVGTVLSALFDDQSERIYVVDT